MTSFSTLLIQITLFLILSKFQHVHGEISCFYEEESEEIIDDEAVAEPIVDATKTCFFINIKTNETSPYFDPKSPKDPLNINTIDVRSSQMSVLTDEFCKAFPNINILDITGSAVKRLQEQALSSCKNLTHLIMYKNEVTEVSPNLFLNNPEMIEISFQFNNLSYLDVGLFEPTQKLVRLILGNNLLVHFNFREMPVLQNLSEFYIEGNNLLDVDEFAVLQKFPNLRSFGFNENLLDCRNLKLVVDAMKEKNLTVIGFIHRKRVSTFTFIEEEGMQCLNRTEHLRATAYYLNEIRLGKTPRNGSCSVKSQDSKKEQKLHIIIVQFVTAGLILLCVLLISWHGVYWRIHLNSMISDKGDYYYCNYYVQDGGNGGRGNGEKKL